MQNTVWMWQLYFRWRQCYIVLIRFQKHLAFNTAGVFITGILSVRMHIRRAVLCTWNDPVVTEIPYILDMAHCNMILHIALLTVNVECWGYKFWPKNTHLNLATIMNIWTVYGYFKSTSLSNIKSSLFIMKTKTVIKAVMRVNTGIMLKRSSRSSPGFYLTPIIRLSIPYNISIIMSIYNGAPVQIPNLNEKLSLFCRLFWKKWYFEMCFLWAQVVE